MYASKYAIMRYLTVVSFIIGFFCSILGQNFQLNPKNFSDKIVFYEKARIKFLPEIGMMEYYPYYVENKIFMYDFVSDNVLLLGKKGDNPEQFKVERSLFSDGVYVYLFDSTKKKILKYRVENNQFKLDDIIQIRNPVGKNGKKNQIIKVLGKVENDWIVQYLITPDIAQLAKNRLAGHSLSVGITNSDFSKYKELYFGEGKNYPQSANSSDSILCQSKGQYYAVVLSGVNFEVNLKKLELQVIDIKNQKTKKIPIKVPEKYAKFQALNNNSDMKERLKISKFKFVPWGARFQGLDEKFYFCYYHYNKDESFDILFNVLDLCDFKVQQFELMNCKMAPIMADCNQIAFVKVNDEDHCELVLLNKKSIIK